MLVEDWRKRTTSPGHLRGHHLGNQNRSMFANAVDHHRIAPRPPAASSVAALFVHDCDYDSPGVLIPHPEIHLGVRFGPSARRGLEEPRKRIGHG